MKAFDTYTTPIWSLTAWLDKTFWKNEFNLFLEQIYEAIFREYKKDILTKEAIIEIKINEVSSIMKHLQNNLALLLRLEIEELYK
jgi:hypothetical protein